MNEHLKLNVFIVDDDKDSAFLMSRHLRKALPGTDVVYFTEANRCIRRLEEDQPSVLITDLNMPAMDGFRLIEWIRSHSAMTFPLIVYSGSGLQSERELCCYLGADVFVSKASGFTGLTKCVRAFIQQEISPAC